MGHWIPALIRRQDRWAWLLAALALALALPVLTYPMGRDQGMYANIGQAIRSGGLPYVDMWDIKPPVIYYVYALGFSLLGASPVAIRALDLLAAPLTLIALYGITHRLAGVRAARWAMLIFPVFYFTETFASLSQSDSLVTLPMTWAAWFALRATDAPRASRAAMLNAAASGMLCAVLVWFKHYYALIVLAFVIEVVWVRRALPIREALAFAAGGVIVGLPPLLYFASNGVLAEMLIVASGTSEYNAQALSGFAEFWAQMWNYILFRWWHWGLLLVLAASYILTRTFQPMTRGRFILLWLLGALSFVAIQAKGFDTHWIPLLPPLVVLAAAALDGWLNLAHWANPWIRRPIVVFALVLFSLILAKDTWVRAWPYVSGAENQRAYFARFQANDLKPAQDHQMVRWLERRTVPGDTVYIWGFRPEVAFMSGLRPATRFQAQFMLVGERYPDSWKQENVDTLWAALPPYVLVMRADYMPWVHGSPDDSNTILANDYKPLRDWLIYNYLPETEIGDFLVYKRKPTEE